jgi:hypothetical protein
MRQLAVIQQPRRNRNHILEMTAHQPVHGRGIAGTRARDQIALVARIE